MKYWLNRHGETVNTIRNVLQAKRWVADGTYKHYHIERYWLGEQGWKILFVRNA